MKLPLCFLLAAALSACSVDTFFYGEPNRPTPQKLNTISQEAQANVLWKTHVKPHEEALYLRPASDGHQLYVIGGRGLLLALDSTGQVQYRHDLKQEIRSGLSVGGGLIFLGTASGELWALHAQDGSLAWRVPLGSTMVAPAAHEQGLVVARTVDGKSIGIDPNDGDVLWRHYSHLPRITLVGQATPLVAGGVVLLGGDNGRLTILNSETGLPLLELPLARPELRPETGLALQDLNATFRLQGDILFGAVYNMYSFAVDLKSGTLLWQQESASTAQDFALSRELMLLSDEQDHVVALHVSDGRTMWRQEALQGRRLSPPVVTAHGVMVLDDEGYVHLLSPRDGSLIGRHKIGKTGSHSAAIYWAGQYVWQLRDGSVVALGEWQ